MSEKRRDSRKRILREGEYQRQDGRYRYRYIDEYGKEQNAYSWRLDKNDPVPRGKKKELSLREKEQQIAAELLERANMRVGNYTVLQLVEKYVSLKTGVRENTKAGYRTVIHLLQNDPFGSLMIGQVRLSDAKAWLVKLQRDESRGYSSIHSIRGVLRPAFQMAVDDDLLKKNPFEFELASVIVNDSVTREAITRKQERDLLSFIKADKHFSRYYDGIFILFKTGLRISEFCGLTVRDIEFEEHRIKVDHQLLRVSTMEYIIEKPKTDR
ncbi:MAG: integrase DNA-binding domain-containing protein, partial [Bacteroidales bacterium]|nr:integrase DNA-binding domain-containing protein [Bacteroidales bacterium]